MNKQSITFKADEQELIKTGGINNYASNIVAYIEATFELGENWTGYDSVRAVWSNDYLTDISTVLDPNGRCIVPTEVLTDTGNVTVNLVGSIADGDTLTDRLTTYPCKAVIVDADAKVEGDETESITPSQFEQFVQIVHDEVEEVTGMSAEAETLPAGSDATASYSDGVLSLGIPQGIQGEQGEQGETGETGAPAGFGDVTASVDNTVGTPSVNVHTSGPDTAKEFDFAFHNLKGDKGDTGDTGATGNGIASTVLNPDYTLTITFTDGTSYTTPSIRGAKGDTGNTGATGNGIQSTVLNADYTLTITFTDGTSYTTPSIRGEQGPVGPVSDVTVNGTSIVDQNGVAKILMPELVKTVQGNPIVLDDAFGEVKNLDVELLPIQAGTGTPSPQNIRPITGHDSVTVGVTGKNLFSGENVTADSYIDENGAVVGYTVGWSASDYTPVTPNTQYTFNPNTTEGGSAKHCFYAEDKTFIGYIPSGARTFTTPLNCKYMRFSFRVTSTDIQLEVGSTPTDYAPYHGQSKTVTLPHTVYGGKPNITTGNGKENWNKITLNDTTVVGLYNWQPVSGTSAFLVKRSAINALKQQYTKSILSDTLQSITYGAIWSGTVGVALVGDNATYSIAVRIPVDGIDTQAKLETYLAQNPITICYEVEEPTDLNTTPTDLTLYNGDNVVSSDGDMELTYVQDMAIVIEKLENLL